MKYPSIFEYDYQHKLLDALLFYHTASVAEHISRSGLMLAIASQVTAASRVREFLLMQPEQAESATEADQEVVNRLVSIFARCAEILGELLGDDWYEELVAAIEDEHTTATGTVGTLVSGVEDAAQAIWSRLSHERDPLPGLHTYVARLTARTYVLLEALVCYAIVEPEDGDYTRLRIMHRIDPDYPRRSA